MTLLAIRDVTLVDGTGADPVGRATVLVDGDSIVTVGSDVTAPADATVIDGDGLTLTPGLIDAHVHFGLPLKVEQHLSGNISAAELAAAIFAIAGDALDQGFTGARDVGGIDGGLVNAVQRGAVRGPRIWSAGAVLCQRGGHGHFAATWQPTERWADHAIPGLAQISTVVDGPDEMRRAARENFRRGASFLKLCVTGGVVSLHDALTDTQFSVDEIRVAVEEARARGTYVTVHAHNNAGVRNAVEAGVKCIEHGSEIDEATAALMVEHGVALVPTLAVATTLAASVADLGLPPEIALRITGKADEMAQAAKIAYTAGVQVGSGSDLFGPDQSYRGMELELKAAVLGPMEALISATRTNAEIIGAADRLGTIEAGKLADLTLWDGDPLAEPKIFATPSRAVVVTKGGALAKDVR